MCLDALVKVGLGGDREHHSSVESARLALLEFFEKELAGSGGMALLEKIEVFLYHYLFNDS